MNFLPQTTENQPPRIPSEGEEFIQDFFDEMGIKYEAEVPIQHLKGDPKQYRVADFFLPQFNIYVEFFGLWNTQKEDYKLKKEIYKRNDIPCVYLYPENLGIIHFIFDKRIQATLLEMQLTKDLFRYRLFKFKNSRQFNWSAPAIGCCLVVILIELVIMHRTAIGAIVLYSILGGIAIYHAWKLKRLYHKIFVEKKYSLQNIEN